MSKAFLILIALLMALSPCSALEKLHVSGRRILTESGREVRLRGVSFGWWVTPVDESDFARAKALGCNYIRLAFTYKEIEESPGVITGKSLKWLDDRMNWAEKQGLWVVPEMHIVPGGQMWSDWCEGGKNLMWTTPQDQDRLIAQWKAVARHFSGRAVIAAYEPMNEPALPNGVTEKDYRNLNERIIKAIRQVDRITPIAIDCTDTGGPTGMAKLLPLDDPQIIYSFHFYFPYEVTHQGQAYPQKDFKGGKLDKALLEEQVRPAIEFEKRVAGPIWLGEFGIGARPNDSIRWLEDVVSLAEKHNWHWGVWNFKEDTGPGSMALYVRDPKGPGYIPQPVLVDFLKRHANP